MRERELEFNATFLILGGIGNHIGRRGALDMIAEKGGLAFSELGLWTRDIGVRV